MRVERSPRRLGGRPWFCTVVAALLILAALPAPSAQAADWPPLDIRISGEVADGQVTVRAELHNRSPYRLSDVTVSGSLPEKAKYLGSELVSSANPGRFDGTAVQFHLEHVNPAAVVGPLVWRFSRADLPETELVHASAQWLRPTMGSAVSSEMNLATLTFLGRQPAEDSPLTERLDGLLSATALQGARAGILVYDPQTGRVEYERDADKAFIPASNAKLLVAAAALDALGADYRFSTVVASSGRLGDDGVLRGDLYLRGEGDPTLSATTLEGWAQAWGKAGLREVGGDLVVDDSYFGTDPGTGNWAGDEEREPFEPQVGALSVDQNQASLVIAPGAAPGDQAQVSKEPATQQVKLYNLATTAASGSTRNLSVVRDEENGRWVIKGRTPVGARPLRRQIAVEHPGLFAGDVLREALQRHGVQFAAGSQVRLGTIPPSAQVLRTYRSEPLEQILSTMLKDSDNFVAEMVLYALGAYEKRVGSNGSGQAVVADFVERMGLSTPFYLCDACGLSANNQVSPELLVGLLTAMRGHRDGQVLRESLAVAGIDGTLADRMRGTSAAGRVQAKTGSLLVASTLSGYVNRKDGSEIVFSILMNCDPDGGWEQVQALRDLQDRLVAVLCEAG